MIVVRANMVKEVVHVAVQVEVARAVARTAEEAVAVAAHVGDIPNRYTCDVVLNQQARVAHRRWYGGWPYRAAQLLESPWQFLRTQELMVDSIDRPMAVCYVDVIV
jgi:hypothetical protein